MKNYVNFAFYFTLLVVFGLIGLHYLPPNKLFGHELRQVDLFSDIKTIYSEDEEIDEPPILILPEKPVFVDTCKTGMTCIEDYGDSTGAGMVKFYEALNQVEQLNRPVRIAVFGDSFIEADILTGDLRSILQTEYGGAGVGFVPITSATYGFRPTVIHSFNGWESHLQTDSTGFVRRMQGIAGGYFMPLQNAYVELRGQKKYAEHLDSCDISTIYYQSEHPLKLKATVNRKVVEARKVRNRDSFYAESVEGSIGSVRWSINEADSAVFYGVAMDSKTGVSLDNFSQRASSGLSLKNIPKATLTHFNELRPYDLIILQYGLNVATQNGRDYDYYRKGLLSTIEYLKECFPTAGILILSVSDRNYKTSDGEYKTMPGVKNLLLYQQAIAMESGVAFWNMYEAMGGEGSMANFVNAKPSKANLDYSHINFRGGKDIARKLADALIYGKEKYDEKREYEE